MLSKEILNDITLGELKTIAKEWHRINDICNATPDGYKQFEVTQEDEYYADRDIDTARYSMRITTFKEEDSKTLLSEYISLYDDECWITDTDIEELESFIKKMEAE